MSQNPPEGFQKPHRRIVVDFNQHKLQQQKTAENNAVAAVVHHTQEQINQDEQSQKNYPLEMQPVLRAVLDYGRRTYSIGALHGAIAIESLIDQIKNLDPDSGSNTPEFREIISSAETISKNLRDKLKIYNP